MAAGGVGADMCEGMSARELHGRHGLLGAAVGARVMGSAADAGQPMLEDEQEAPEEAPPKKAWKVT